MNPTKTLPVGTLLHGTGGSYRIGRVLGQGSFGITYLASVVMEGRFAHVETGVSVAVKEFYMRDFCARAADGTVGQGTDGTLVAHYAGKFLKEARNLAELRHPGIIKVIDCFNAMGTAYYVMEYVEGCDLSVYLREHGPMPEDEARRAIRAVGEALDYMHGRRMLHLDLKPANVMRRKADGRLLLIDFGLAKRFTDDGLPETSTTVGLGTPGYAPVEQADAADEKDLLPTLDVYALGATYYKLLTGETPPKASVVMNEGLPLGPLRDRGISPCSVEAIAGAMQPRRADRLPSVAGFLARLGGAEDGPPRPSTEPDGDEATRILDVRPPRTEAVVPPPAVRKDRRKWLVPLVAVAVLVAFGLFCTKYNVWPSTWNFSSSEADSVDLRKREILDRLVSNMVRVEGGTFTMGATAEQGSDADSDEKPHRVTVSSFSVGKYEVTQEEWEAVMGSNPSKYKGARLPVENVSWDDCQAFIGKLNQLTGKSFRLPTEAEWEFAARGGTLGRGFKYSGSNDIDAVAWHHGNSGLTPHAVGGKQANELGLYDMSGNVREWCSDWYGTYGSSSQTNPAGPSSGSYPYRVDRGGGWYNVARYCRVSYRSYGAPHDGGSYLGLRLVLDE